MGTRAPAAALLVKSTTFTLLLLLLLPQRLRGADTTGATVFPTGTVFPAGTMPAPAPGPRVAFVRCRAPCVGEFTCEWGVRVYGSSGDDLGATEEGEPVATEGDLLSIPAEIQHWRLIYAFYGEEEEEEEEEEDVRECVSGEPQLARTRGGLMATFRCQFPDSDVLYFTPLRISILWRGTGVGPWGGPPLYHASGVYIDQLVLVNPPCELAVRSNGQQGHLRASWAPAPGCDFVLMFQLRYERRTLAGSATPDPVATPHEQTVYETSVELLLLDEEIAVATYAFRVRAKASDQGQYTGPWSAWSSTVMAAPLFVTGKLDVRCFTADLLLVVCEWQGARGANLSDTSFTASYQVGWGPTQPCEAEWRREWEELGEEEDGRGPVGRCKFLVQGAAPATVLVTVNASNARGRHEEHFGPFYVQHQVRPGPPVNVSAEPDGTAAGDVMVAWEPPNHQLRAHLHYELRYVADNFPVWKLVSVGRAEGGRHRLHSLRPGPGYRVQVRARPDGVSFAGEWGAWSTPISVKPPTPTDGAAGLVRALVAVALLLLLFTALGASFAHAGRIKQRVWPSLPSLETHVTGLLQRWLGEPYEVGCAVVADSVAQMCVVEVVSELMETSPSAGRKEMGTSKVEADVGVIDAVEGKYFDDLGKEAELPLLIESAQCLEPKSFPVLGSLPPPRNNNNNNKDTSVVCVPPSGPPHEYNHPDRRSSQGVGEEENVAAAGSPPSTREGPPRREYVRHGHVLSLWSGLPFTNGNLSNLAYVPPLESVNFATSGGDAIAATSAGRLRSSWQGGSYSRRPSGAEAPRPTTPLGRHLYMNCAERCGATTVRPSQSRDCCAACDVPGQSPQPYVNQSVESSV